MEGLRRRMKRISNRRPLGLQWGGRFLRSPLVKREEQRQTQQESQRLCRRNHNMSFWRSIQSQSRALVQRAFLGGAHMFFIFKATPLHSPQGRPRDVRHVWTLHIGYTESSETALGLRQSSTVGRIMLKSPPRLDLLWERLRKNTWK